LAKKGGEFTLSESSSRQEAGRKRPMTYGLAAVQGPKNGNLSGGRGWRESVGDMRKGEDQEQMRLGDESHRRGGSMMGEKDMRAEIIGRGPFAVLMEKCRRGKEF